MREYSTSIREALYNGLKPGKARDGRLYLSECYNLVAYEDATEGYREVEEAFENLARQWPFPQWLRLTDLDLAISSDDVFEVSGSLAPFILNPLNKSSWDLTNFTEPFQGISYGRDWMLLNRDGCIYSYEGTVQSSERLKASAFVLHNNRSVIGGPLEGLWSSDWVDFLSNYIGSTDILYDINIGENFIFWSSFDSKDFPFALLRPDLIVNNSYWFEDMLRHNEWGFLEMSFKGAVLNITRFRDDLVVLGEDGIEFVRANPDLPGASYGSLMRLPFGIKSRGACYGDESLLLFIDSKNRLIRFTGEGQGVLDFSYYMSQLSDDVVITKDPNKDNFFISDGVLSFILVGERLFQIFQGVSSINDHAFSTVGTTFELGSRDARLKTDYLDLNAHSNKTLVGTSIINTWPLKGFVTAETEIRGQKYTAPKIPLNPEGYTATRIYGRLHQVQWDFDSFEDKNIRLIELKWQSDDARQRRGISGFEDASGASEYELG